MEADCLNYEILLAKLHVYRIRGLSEDWFGLIELTEDRKSKQCHLIQLFFFFFFDLDTLKHGFHIGQF